MPPSPAAHAGPLALVWRVDGNALENAHHEVGGTVDLALIGPPLRLESRETRRRVGEKRVVLRYEFHFWQDDKLVYRGDQSAMFFKDKPL